MNNNRKYVTANEWSPDSVKSIPSISSCETPVNETGYPVLTVEINPIRQLPTILPSVISFPVDPQIENPANITNSSFNRFLNENFRNQSNDQMNPHEANIIIDGIKALKTENSDLKSKANSLENEKKYLTEENENLKKNLDHKSKELKDTIVAKDSEIQSHEISNSDLLNSNTRLQNTINLLKSRLSDCESLTRRTKDSLQNSYRQEKDELEKQIDDCTIENTRLRDGNKVLEKSKGFLSKELKDLNDEHHRLKKDFTNLENNYEYLKSKLNSSEKKITNLMKENHEQELELDEKTNFTKSLIEQNKYSKNTMENQIAELKDQLKIETSKCNKIKDNLQKEIKSLRAELKEFKDLNKIITEENTNLNIKLKLLEEKKKNTENSFDSYKNEAKNTIQLLIDNSEKKEEPPQWWKEHMI